MPLSSGDRPRIAVFAGPTATILNSHPLTTSRKAIDKYGLGTTDAGFDVLRPQRLARPATVYVEQFSAHPLERDAADLYAAPDGYVGPDGSFSVDRRSDADKPVYEVEMHPADGLYPLPFMGRRANGGPWDGRVPPPGAGARDYVQTFYPDAARLFEEIDRFEMENGANNLLSSRAEFDFFRPAPAGGYQLGLAEADRTDTGSGDIAAERLGSDYFPYWPPALRREPLSATLARLTNQIQQVLSERDYLGAIWLEGSPFVEETSYWLNLLLDVRMPVVACAGNVGSAGRANIIDAVSYLTSGLWADDAGRDRIGVVCVQDEQIFTAREVQKTDDRPGGYVATGGHGGVIGTIGKPGPPVLTFLPVRQHTWTSAVRVTELPDTTRGLRSSANGVEAVPVSVLDEQGELRPEAVPAVRIIKHARYLQRSAATDDTVEVELLGRLYRDLEQVPLVGFVFEAGTPYGDMSRPVEQALRTLAYQGVPFVKVGRGDVGGFVPKGRVNIGIAGGNLTATKARLLLMACLLRFGVLPPARDPEHPTDAEQAAVAAHLADYQAAFDSH